MQVPLNNAYSNNQRFPPPNNFQWRPHFTPRGPARFKTPGPQWRQPSPHEYTNEFWCETCDKGFRTPDILDKHKQQHQKCNIDGCQFIAHPKVITKHIQMQHASGLYKKIAKLQDPEEIKKWREERKKKYPTKENVERAAAAIKEKVERGEKMGLKNNRHGKNLKAGSGIGDKKKPFDKRNSYTSHSKQNFSPDRKKRKICPGNTVNKLPPTEDTRKLQPFAGIQELMTDTDEQLEEPQCNFNIEDEDEVEQVDAHIPQESSGTVCLALSSLICNYGSSDEDESDNAQSVISNRATTINTEIVIDKNTSIHVTDRISMEPINDVVKQEIVSTTNESDDDSGPEEIKLIKPIIIETEIKETKPPMNRRKAKDNTRQKPVFRRPKPKLPPTLLQKLLFKEMRHERNVVLQCIRHIIRNNFFDNFVK